MYIKTGSLEDSLSSMPCPFDKAFICALLHLDLISLPLVMLLLFSVSVVVVFFKTIVYFQSELEGIVEEATHVLKPFVDSLRLGFPEGSMSEEIGDDGY